MSHPWDDVNEFFEYAEEKITQEIMESEGGHSGWLQCFSGTGWHPKFHRLQTLLLWRLDRRLKKIDLRLKKIEENTE